MVGRGASLRKKRDSETKLPPRIGLGLAAGGASGEPASEAAA